jgi:hypothetical protein
MIGHNEWIVSGASWSLAARVVRREKAHPWANWGIVLTNDRTADKLHDPSSRSLEIQETGRQALG